MRGCRGCGITLTPENARRYNGRWVGACRACESAECRARYERVASRNVRLTAQELDDILGALPADPGTDELAAAIRKLAAARASLDGIAS